MITERPYALEHVVRGISFLGCGVCFIANVVCSCDSGGAAATDRSSMNGAATPTKYMFMYKKTSKIVCNGIIKIIKNSTVTSLQACFQSFQ